MAANDIPRNWLALIAVARSQVFEFLIDFGRLSFKNQIHARSYFQKEHAQRKSNKVNCHTAKPLDEKRQSRSL